LISHFQFLSLSEEGISFISLRFLQHPVPILSVTRFRSTLISKEVPFSDTARGRDKEGVIIGRFYAPHFLKSNMFLGIFPCPENRGFRSRSKLSGTGLGN